MIEVKAPGKIPFIKSFPDRVFMAGSIEMGTAEDWQTKFKNTVSDLDIILLNPRRDDWDKSWVQSIHNSQFKEQVTWELDNLEDADFVVFYFDPKTMSPITLMELGHISSVCHNAVIVCCPDGFWRKGNVEILCERKNYTLVNTLEELISKFRQTFKDFNDET